MMFDLYAFSFNRNMRIVNGMILSDGDFDYLLHFIDIMVSLKSVEIKVQKRFHPLNGVRVFKIRCWGVMWGLAPH